MPYLPGTFRTSFKNAKNRCFLDNDVARAGVLLGVQRLAPIMNYRSSSTRRGPGHPLGGATQSAPAMRRSKEQTVMTKSHKLLVKAKKVRGASMVEYGLLLFAVIIAAAAAVRQIGPKIRAAGDKSVENLKSD
jgi:Flp pilus assembly pilin Flp